MKTRIGLTTLILLTAAASTVCSGKKIQVPPVDPEKLYQQTEAAIQDNYIFADDARYAPANLYAAAIKTLDPAATASDRKTLLEKLRAVPEENRRRAVLTSLRAFLAALPAGDNDFAAPEGIALMRDPEKNAGIGLVVRTDGLGKFLGVDVFEGSPAQKAGVKPGHYITKVDGEDVAQMDRNEVIGRIRGPAGSRVKVDFDDGTSYTIERGQGEMQNMLKSTWEVAPGNEAEYLALRSALPGTAERISTLFSRMARRTAVILDLRRLQEGEIDEAFRIADLFVDGGRMGSIKMKGSDPKVFDAEKGTAFDGRVFVIVGKNSSPVARTLAMALGNSANVTLFAPSSEAKAFLARGMPVDGGIELHITSGYIQDGKGEGLHKSGLTVKTMIDDYLPDSPPGVRPNKADPGQVQVAKELGMAL